MDRIGEGYKITMIKEVYHRTSSGRSWKAKPDSSETELIDARRYNLYIDSCKYFNSHIDGQSCRKEYGYSFAGYIPLRVTTVGPFRETKIVARFIIDREDK